MYRFIAAVIFVAGVATASPFTLPADPKVHSKHLNETWIESLKPQLETGLQSALDILEVSILVLEPNSNERTIAESLQKKIQKLINAINYDLFDYAQMQELFHNLQEYKKQLPMTDWLEKLYELYLCVVWYLACSQYIGDWNQCDTSCFGDIFQP